MQKIKPCKHWRNAGGLLTAPGICDLSDSDLNSLSHKDLFKQILSHINLIKFYMVKHHKVKRKVENREGFTVTIKTINLKAPRKLRWKQMGKGHRQFAEKDQWPFKQKKACSAPLKRFKLTLHHLSMRQINIPKFETMLCGETGTLTQF